MIGYQAYQVLAERATTTASVNKLVAMMREVCLLSLLPRFETQAHAKKQRASAGAGPKSVAARKFKQWRENKCARARKQGLPHLRMLARGNPEVISAPSKF